MIIFMLININISLKNIVVQLCPYIIAMVKIIIIIINLPNLNDKLIAQV